MGIGGYEKYAYFKLLLLRKYVLQHKFLGV